MYSGPEIERLVRDYIKSHLTFDFYRERDEKTNTFTTVGELKLGKEVIVKKVVPQ